MSAITNQPLNLNFLSPVGFSFIIKKLPHVNFFVQSVALPGISIGSVSVPTPFKQYPLPSSTSVSYSDLIVTFKVDEDMMNYKEIFNWIISMSPPDDFSQYKEPTLSDATLIINNSAKAPNIIIAIEDLFPVALSPIGMETTDTQLTYIEGTVSFKFRNYYFT